MSQIEKYTTDNAQGRPDANQDHAQVLPKKPEKAIDAAGRIEPESQPAIHREDPRPGEPQDTLHVVPHDDSWTITVEGASESVAVTPTKVEAENAARSLARQKGMRVVIHRADGTIQSTVNYA